jgi:hypothetical protein
MRWAGHVADMREGRGVYRVLEGKPGGMRHRWDNNSMLDLEEM